MRTPERTDDDDERVTLSTLHGAKGLEFATVVTVGFDAEHLPHRPTVAASAGRRQRARRGGTPPRLRRHDPRTHGAVPERPAGHRPRGQAAGDGALAFVAPIPGPAADGSRAHRTAGRAARRRHEGTTRSRTLPVTGSRRAAAETSRLVDHDKRDPLDLPQPPRRSRDLAAAAVAENRRASPSRRARTRHLEGGRRSTTMEQIGRGRMDARRAAKATPLPCCPPVRTPPVTDPAPATPRA